MNIMFITGAGISTGSGLSTYRGADGSYTEIERELGMPIEALLTLKMLEQKPALVWKYWLKFSQAIKDAKPSITHLAMHKIAKICNQFLEVTQNVDGLSKAAGLKDHQLIEIHGTCSRHTCMACDTEHELALTASMAIPPRCYLCSPQELNGTFTAPVIRPSVVLFNENISEPKRMEARTFAQRTADLLVISGTSLMFPYLIEMVAYAVANGVRVLNIDPQATSDNPFYGRCDPSLDLPGSITCIRKTSDEVFPSLYAFLAEQKREDGDAEDFLVEAIAFEDWVTTHIKE